MHGASNHSEKERVALDFYATPRYGERSVR